MTSLYVFFEKCYVSESSGTICESIGLDMQDDGLPNYTGYVVGIPHSVVFGYFRDGAVFDGTVYADDEIYYLEHAKKCVIRLAL
jgi:hypothetical protein